MSLDLELIRQNENNCLISGLFTVNYINSIILSGNNFISDALTPVFDFSSVSVCDSSSVALLVYWWRFAKKQNKTIQFTNMPNEMLAIMKVSGIDSLL